MTHLPLSFFGGFDILLDSAPISGLKSDKVRALLAYLAVEASRPHRREALAGLLWPDSSDTAALNSLRNALANLRRVLGDAQAAQPFFQITRETICFNLDADCQLDVAEFERQNAKPKTQISHLQYLVSLYRGPLLAGFSVESAPFEEWALYKREQFQRQAVEALHTLAAHHEAAGEYAAAADYARQQLALEPYDEEAHRQLMRALALSDQRPAALRQYETCRQLLAAELGVSPVRQTVALYEAIRDGSLRGTATKQPTLSLSSTSAYQSVTSAAFVGRERELARLNNHLAGALAGQGQVAFITGDAGSGKTALASEFARQAMATSDALLVAIGSCSAQASIGDPYLPFVEILELLTGDIEARRAGGTISPEHARRLWEALPYTLQVLTETGPDLIGRFMPAAPLALRADERRHPRDAWQRRLAELVKQATSKGANRPLLQPPMRLFDQVVDVLTAVARRHPLVLILDDLHWADSGSLSLLFHLGQRLAGSRILVIGTYRPGDLVAVGDTPLPSQGGGRGAGERFPGQSVTADEPATDAHRPLTSVINELTHVYGDIVIDLAQADGRRFLEAFLNSEPNRLGGEFRAALYRHTGGHALFTVELLRGLQERGDLIRDEMGRWKEGPSLNWACIPARIEAVIAERIGQLSARNRALLTVASVEGEEFTAEVLARVLDLNENTVIEQLSGPLCRQHHLVFAHSLRRLSGNGQRLSRYRFQHALFQEYLYRNLDTIERSRLHEAVGRTLDTLCAGNPDEIEMLSPRLAWHFAEAGLTEKAANYLLRAGRRAMQLAASEEAVSHFTRGLMLLHTLPESADRAQLEMELQFALGAAFVAFRGWGTPERTNVFARAIELGRRAGELSVILQAMTMQADQYRAAGECDRSRALADQMLEIANHTGEPLHLMLAHFTMGSTLLLWGELPSALDYLEKGLAGWDAQGDSGLTTLFGTDLGVLTLCWLAWTQWGLGYPEQALRRSQEALAYAERLTHQFMIGVALHLGVLSIAVFRGDEQAVSEGLAALAKVNEGQESGLFRVWQATFLGWLQVRQGETAAGIATLRGAIAAWEASGSRSGRPFQLTLLAEAYLRNGQTAAGLAAVAAALGVIEQGGMHLFEAECWRLRGDLAIAARSQNLAGGETPEGCFRRAIEIARRQGAKAWELRATISLCRLWQSQGRVDEAWEFLAAVYHWFTEGFDTSDLRAARSLLVELEAAAAQESHR